MKPSLRPRRTCSAEATAIQCPVIANVLLLRRCNLDAKPHRIEGSEIRRGSRDHDGRTATSPSGLRRIAIELSADVSKSTSVEGLVTANAGLIPVVAVLLIAFPGEALNPAHARAETNCLSAPNGQAPQGSHWHYRLDRPKQRKCWYLRSQGSAHETATAAERPRVHAVAAAPEPKSTAPGPDRLVAEIRLEPRSDQPALAPADDRATQPSRESATGLTRKTQADSAATREPASPVISDDVAVPGSRGASGRLRRAAQSVEEERAHQAPDAPATAANTPAKGEADQQVAETASMAASRRMMPLGILLAGAILVVAGIFVHPIVQIFARRPVHYDGREASAWITGVAGEWAIPKFLTHRRDAGRSRPDKDYLDGVKEATRKLLAFLSGELRWR
jgi:hypothetical protein